jgi:hypothetical protein
MGGRTASRFARAGSARGPCGRRRRVCARAGRRPADAAGATPLPSSHATARGHHRDYTYTGARARGEARDDAARGRCNTQETTASKGRGGRVVGRSRAGGGALPRAGSRGVRGGPPCPGWALGGGGGGAGPRPRRGAASAAPRAAAGSHLKRHLLRLFAHRLEQHARQVALAEGRQHHDDELVPVLGARSNLFEAIAGFPGKGGARQGGKGGGGGAGQRGGVSVQKGVPGAALRPPLPVPCGRLPLKRARAPTLSAATVAAPLEMPVSRPSSVARRRAIVTASSLVTWGRSGAGGGGGGGGGIGGRPRARERAELLRLHATTAKPFPLCPPPPPPPHPHPPTPPPAGPRRRCPCPARPGQSPRRCPGSCGGRGCRRSAPATRRARRRRAAARGGGGRRGAAAFGGAETAPVRLGRAACWGRACTAEGLGAPSSCSPAGAPPPPPQPVPPPTHLDVGVLLLEVAAGAGDGAAGADAAHQDVDLRAQRARGVRKRGPGAGHSVPTRPAATRCRPGTPNPRLPERPRPAPCRRSPSRSRGRWSHSAPGREEGAQEPFRRRPPAAATQREPEQAICGAGLMLRAGEAPRAAPWGCWGSQTAGG